jgi:hypothetical protein
MLTFSFIIIELESVVFLLTEIYQPKGIGLISAINLLVSKGKFDQEKIEGSPIQVSCMACACLLIFGR